VRCDEPFGKLGSYTKLAGDKTMVFVRTISCLMALLFFAISINKASAVSAEVAKKCQILMAEAFPPREPGNPAAGSAKGSAQSQRDYFTKCVANGANVDKNQQTKQ
jgi:hypothetical protein